MPFIDEILVRLKAAWPIIQASPETAFAVLALGLLVGWLITRLYYKQSAEIARERMALKDERIKEYEEKLQGRSPEEAKQRIEELEARVARIASREWPSLTEDGFGRLQHRLTSTEKAAVEVFAEDSDGTALAKSLIAAFGGLGWSAKRNKSMNPLDEGLIVYPNSETGSAVRSALARALGCDVEIRDDAHVKDRCVLIAIGHRKGI